MHLRLFNTFEPVSPFYRDLLPFLAARGYELEVVISSRRYREGRPALSSCLTDPRIHLRQIPAGTGVARSRRHKMWAMLTYGAGAMLASLLGPAVRINFFLSQPPLFSLWGYLLRKVRGQPYICLVMDLYPDVALQSGWLPPASRLARALTALSRFALGQADAVVVIGRCMAERLIAAGIRAERIHLIPNWSNAKEIYPVTQAHNRLRKTLGLNNHFVVLYSGNMGTAHFFDDILAAANQLRAVPGLQFLFVGEGSRKREVIAAVAQHQLGNVQLLPLQPVEFLADSLSMADLHFVCLREGFEGLMVPSKAYGALASGRPLLYQGEAGGEIARMIQAERVGTVVPPHAPEQLASAILDYYQNPERVRQEGKRACRLSRGKYCRERALARYLTLFQEFAEDGHG